MSLFFRMLLDIRNHERHSATATNVDSIFVHFIHACSRANEIHSQAAHFETLCKKSIWRETFKYNII